MNLTVTNLRENTAYTFRFDSRLKPSATNQDNVIQEFQFQTASGQKETDPDQKNDFVVILVKQYDPSLFLEKVEQSLENVVSNVMRTGKSLDRTHPSY